MLQHSIPDRRDKSHSPKDAAYLPLADSHLEIDWLGEGLARQRELLTHVAPWSCVLRPLGEPLSYLSG